MNVVWGQEVMLEMRGWSCVKRSNECGLGSRGTAGDEELELGGVEQ